MFVRAPVDARTHFFVMSFNSKGNLVMFIDPPSALVNSLGLFIRAVFPGRIVKEHISDDGVFAITLNPGIDGTLCLPLYTVFFLSTDGGTVIFSNGPREKSLFGAYSQIHQLDGIQTRCQRANAMWALRTGWSQGNLVVQRLRVVVVRSQVMTCFMFLCDVLV